MNVKEKMIIVSALKEKLHDTRMNRLHPFSTGNIDMVKFWDNLIKEIEDLIIKVRGI